MPYIPKVTWSFLVVMCLFYKEFSHLFKFFSNVNYRCKKCKKSLKFMEMCVMEKLYVGFNYFAPK